MLEHWIAAVEGWVPALAGSLWVYPALMLFAMVDGFFPPIPSESVVIALASLAVSQGQPNILLLGLAGAVGAFTGDQIAYTIGSKVDVRRLRLFRTARGRRALDWAEHALVHRGSSFILAARYIPVGRVAVNMTAGALGYPRKRFVGLTALAAVTWSAYGSLVGAGAGVWLADHPVWAVAAGVVVGTVVGLAIDWVLRRWTGLVGREATWAPHARTPGPDGDARALDGAGTQQRGEGASVDGPSVEGPSVGRAPTAAPDQAVRDSAGGTGAAPDAHPTADEHGPPAGEVRPAAHGPAVPCPVPAGARPAAAVCDLD